MGPRSSCFQLKPISVLNIPCFAVWMVSVVSHTLDPSRDHTDLLVSSKFWTAFRPCRKPKDLPPTNCCCSWRWQENRGSLRKFIEWRKVVSNLWNWSVAGEMPAVAATCWWCDLRWRWERSAFVCCGIGNTFGFKLPFTSRSNSNNSGSISLDRYRYL